MKHFPDGFKVVDLTVNGHSYTFGVIEQHGGYDFGSHETERNIEVLRGRLSVRRDSCDVGSGGGIAVQPGELIDVYAYGPVVFLCRYGPFKLHEVFSLSVDNLELSVRSRNCFTNYRIETIVDIVRMTEEQMLRKVHKFGRKSLNELKEILASMGLRFGMSENDIRDYPVVWK